MRLPLRSSLFCFKLFQRKLITSGTETTRRMVQSSSDDSEIFNRKDIFPDLNNVDGPLKSYRSKSSFDWRKLRLIVEDEESWKLRYKIWNFLQEHSMFHEREGQQPIDEKRRIATKKAVTIFHQNFFGPQEYFQRPELYSKFNSAIVSYDPSVSVKLSLGFGMFPNTLRSLGTDRIMDIVGDNQEIKNLGCFALTEFSHGSNARGIKTKATYDRESKSFILHSPDFESAKCWVGNLGKTATHAIVYAQLHTPDGTCHGMNAFCVPIRDPHTMLPYPGVIVGDLGEKLGLNGLDNGFVMFDNYHIPKDYLLSKTGDVNDEGQFVSQYKNQKERMGKSLGALSGGRVSICEIAVTYGVKAITIATRYSASRKQFGPEDSNAEFPVIEYQSQQYRLLPHLASIFAIQIFSNFIGKVYGQLIIKTMMGEDSTDTGLEMHALSSVAKPICAWTVRDIIQECREACGGHGYLKYAGIGELRDQNDANCTYEGENNILIQQSSNFLLNTRKRGWESFSKKTELGTVEFLKNGEQILQSKWKWSDVDDAMHPQALLATLDWICVYLLEKTSKRVKVLQSEGKSQFDVRNNSQVFGAINLSIAYGHRSIFYVLYNRISELSASAERDLLVNVLSLYGANIIVKNYIGIIYEGGFAQSHKAGELLETGILRLLPKLKNECVSMVDAIAPPDFIINSPLGMQDGKVYAHLKSHIYRDPDTFTRPSWWAEILKPENLTSKL